MNAIQFIQQHGIDKARGVVEGAPDGARVYVGITKRYFSSPSRLYDFEEMEWEEMDRGMDLDLYEDQIWLEDLKRLVESVDIISKFDSVQEAKDAISNAPDGATEFRKLSCRTRYIKVTPRFFEYWDGSIWCRPTVPFTDETHILRFTELSKLEQAIADYESIYGGEHV